ncbi:MAG TPA: NUDIX domain-containing protein [Candidatus Saccharimonadales bacterium]|nr:NUDIX domain-containing protein [Candidatus Saccharimonadales bacterium]
MTHWTQRHRVVLAVYLILQKDGQVLLMRRANTGYMDGKYGLPAGHVESGERATAAMVREAKEEVGVRVSARNLQLVHTMHRRAEEGDHERIDLFFAAQTWQGEPRNMEPHKCDELRWCPVVSLPKNTIPVVRQALDCIEESVLYSEAGF